MPKTIDSVPAIRLAGLSGEVEGYYLVLKNLGEGYSLSELICRSGVGFRLYHHRGRHLSGIDGRWFLETLDYHGWDPFSLLADWTGYTIVPLGKVSTEAAWERVKRSVDEGRPPIARCLEAVWQPSPVVGYDESTGERALLLRDGSGDLYRQSFAENEKGPPFDNWIERMLMIEKRRDGRRGDSRIKPVLALAVRLAREGLAGDG